jgi:hypothetical protein
MRRAFVPQRHGSAAATIDSPPQTPPHFRRVPVAISLGSRAEVRRIEEMTGTGLEIGRRPVEW